MLSYLFIIACFVYIIQALLKLDVDLIIIFASSSIIYYVPSVIVVMGNLLLAAFVYKINIQIMTDSKVSYYSVAKVYIESNIGKYLPGNFMHFAGRNIMGALIGLKQKDLLTSTILLLIQTLSAAFLISLVLNLQGLIKTLIFLSVNYRSIIIPFIAIIIILMLTLYICVLKYKKQAISSYLNRHNINIILMNMIIMMVYLLLYSISFFIILIPNTTNLDVIMVPTIITSFILAWLVGTIVPGAPGGLGVREAVLLFLLKDYLVSEELMLAVISYRLVTVTADIFGLLLFRGFLSYCYKDDKKELN